jgi:FtsZ-binding cell division protein ZapB
MCSNAQKDYDDLRNSMQPLSDAVQQLQAERAELVQQLQQVGSSAGWQNLFAACSAGRVCWLIARYGVHDV